MNLWKDLGIQWRHGGLALRLVLVNVAVFLLLWVSFAVLWAVSGSREAALALVQNHILAYLSMPSDLHLLAWRPWTVGTSLFTHLDPQHIFWNMVMFWGLGRMYMDILGPRRLLGTYLAGGLAGNLLFAVAMNTFHPLPGMPAVMGASGSVTAVIMMIAAYRPHMLVNLMFIGPVKLMYVAAVFLLLDFIGFGSSDGVAHEAHIGGALYGLVAAMQLRNGRDWSSAVVNGLQRVSSFFTFRRRSKLRVEKFDRRKVRVMQDADYNASKRAKEERVNAILDKISRSGYDSLSKEEKDVLFRASHDQ